jgi:hypothetical protein
MLHKLHLLQQPLEQSIVFVDSKLTYFFTFDNVQIAIIFILRGVTVQTTLPVTVLFIVILQGIYPVDCRGVYQCQKMFRQQLLNKFLTNRKLFLTIFFVDGHSISFEAFLDYIIEYYGEYRYASVDNIVKIKKIKCFRS